MQPQTLGACTFHDFHSGGGGERVKGIYARAETANHASDRHLECLAPLSRR